MLKAFLSVFAIVFVIILIVFVTGGIDKQAFFLDVAILCGFGLLTYVIYLISEASFKGKERFVMPSLEKWKETLDRLDAIEEKLGIKKLEINYHI